VLSSLLLGKPPIEAMLNQNVLCGLVPDGFFCYGKAESELFRHDWTGWANTGCMLFLRPGYTLQGHNSPALYARALSEDLKFAMAHSMKGAECRDAQSAPLGGFAGSKPRGGF
jgi:hypothetical protein